MKILLNQMRVQRYERSRALIPKQWAPANAPIVELASGLTLYLLVSSADNHCKHVERLDPDQAQQSIGSDLDLNYF